MPNSPSAQPTIAVVIPCYQEAVTIGKVIADFRRELPDARIYVYDNNCTDGTGEIRRQGRRSDPPRKTPGQGLRRRCDVRADSGGHSA